VRIKNLWAVILVIAALAGVSCASDNTQYGDLKFDYTTFKSEKSNWQALDIKDYTYEYYSAGFFYYHLLVEVEDGEYKNSSPLTNSELDIYTNTINDIYTKIESDYLSEKNKLRPDYELYLKEIDIEYDVDFHFPHKVSYIYHIPEGTEVDGNPWFRITNFTAN
jgi:hypothetical protein